MADYIVYKHTSPSGGVYIGITSQEPERRWRSDGSGYRQNTHFYNAIKKYGWDAFKHEILFEGLELDEALRIEKELIQKYQSYKHGYNSSLGGDYGGYTDTVKQKIKKSVSALWQDDEYRKHMSEAHKGNATSKGYKHSERSKALMSKASKERWKDESFRAKMIASFKGRPYEGLRERMLKQQADPVMKEKLTAHLYGNHYRAKKVICIETGEIFDSVTEAAKSVNGTRESIGRACRGLAKKSHGRHWRFADET